MTAIIGGKGLKNKKEKSKNYLVKQREIFTNPELNYCFFPNFSKAENAAYLGRASKKRAGGAAALFIIMDLRQLGRKSQTILQSGLLPMQIL